MKRNRPRVVLPTSGVIDREFDDGILSEYDTRDFELSVSSLGVDDPIGSQAQTARKRKKGVDTEHYEDRRLPESEPPGWAET